MALKIAPWKMDEKWQRKLVQTYNLPTLELPNRTIILSYRKVAIRVRSSTKSAVKFSKWAKCVKIWPSTKVWGKMKSDNSKKITSAVRIFQEGWVLTSIYSEKLASLAKTHLQKEKILFRIWNKGKIPAQKMPTLKPLLTQQWLDRAVFFLKKKGSELIEKLMRKIVLTISQDSDQCGKTEIWIIRKPNKCQLVASDPKIRREWIQPSELQRK